MMGFEAQSMESLGNGRLLAREVLDKWVSVKYLLHGRWIDMSFAIQGEEKMKFFWTWQPEM